MAEVKLAARKRTSTGKGPARQARREGRVPATLYGHGVDPLSIDLDRRDLITAFHTDSGMNVLLDIEIEGGATLAIARELQRDPVRGTLLHADFVAVDRAQEIEVDVPLHLVGESTGVKSGGVLEQPLFTLHVRCTVADVPDGIDADISALDIGDALRVADLAPDATFTILDDPDVPVAIVAAPISEEELEAMEAEAGVEQEAPEMVGEEVEAGEEPAEAEEAAPPPEEPSEEGQQG
ncbi:MAG: 50S ribosomal protein L25 [Actinobacteria bacterium]|nr:50S ribosomal protein L25 [Actinomycetota bacterium]